MRPLLATAVALSVMLAASCVDDGPTPPGGDATPAPTPTATESADPVATATPTPTAAPAPPATATPTVTSSSAPPATPTPTTTSTPSPTPTPTPTTTPTPEPPPVTVQGPLLVLSERVGDAPPRRGDEVETRRVFLYDVAEDRYWAAFDYENPRTLIGLGGQAHRSAVQPAGTSIVVWSGGQVRRMGLDGETQAVLFEDETIRAIRVSPDGAKVAVMHGEPGTLLVLDARDGAEVLRVASDHPDLGTLWGGGRFRMLDLGDWRDDGKAVSVTAGDYSGPSAHTAVLELDGAIHVLAERLIVSPNLRYAIQVGEIIEISPATRHQPLYASLTVINVETGQVESTIAESGGLQPSGVHGFWFGRYLALNLGGSQLVDPATGERLSRTPDIEREVSGPVRSTCGVSDLVRPTACYVQYGEQIVWEGAHGWTRYLGVIEMPRSLKLRGIGPVRVASTIATPPPPARDKMVGPLLAYEVHGEYDYHFGEGRPDPSATRRVIVYDEGADRSWLAFTYQNWFAHNYTPGLAQAADGGFVAEIRPVHLTPNGQARALLDDRPHSYRVAPDGRKLVASFPARTVVVAIPSGEEITRLVHDDLPSTFGLALSGEGNYWSAHHSVWTSDSEAILLLLIDGDGVSAARVYGILATLEGEVRLAPCVTDDSAGLSCVSPDARYMVRGRSGTSDHYVARGWRSFDIIDFETDRVLWTAETPGLPYYLWEWAGPDHFAWSSGRFIFHGYRLPDGVTRAEVSVLDVTTGEVEVMDSAEYLARFHPPSRATTECPEHPAQACRILLDGEVIGEGRWPRIIGFIELD